jgi:hypothetical protein
VLGQANSLAATTAGSAVPVAGPAAQQVRQWQLLLVLQAAWQHQQQLVRLCQHLLQPVQQEKQHLLQLQGQ